MRPDDPMFSTLDPATAALLARTMNKRTDAGLRLAFLIPDRAEPFVCYPRDHAQKARWTESAKAKGWTLA